MHGGNVPNLLKVATDIQNLRPRNHHTPRPDERHIRYQDARDLKQSFIPNLI
jgi:pyridoxine 5-phosphate synthase